MYLTRNGYALSTKDEHLDWASGQDKSTVPETAECQRFLFFLYKLVLAGEASEGIFTTALKACQKHMADCIAKRNGPPLPKGHVRNLAGIVQATREINDLKKERSLKGHEDMQQETEETLPPDQLLQAATFLYSFEKTTVFDLTPLMMYNTMVEFYMGMLMLSRGEDTRFYSFGIMFVATLLNVGRMGTKVLGFITSCGKTNASGHHSKTGVGRHKNPLLCVIGVIGLLFLFRFIVLKEPTPDFIDYKEIYETPLLRSSVDQRKSTSYDVQYQNIVLLFRQLGIDPSAKTHFGRGYGQRLLDSLGVDIEMIARLAAKHHDAMHDSYVTGLPWKSILGITGFDPENPKEAYAAHCSVELTEQDIYSLPGLEFLLVQRQRVDAAVAAAVAKGTGTMAQERLYTAKGSLLAFFFIIQTCLLVAAARPRNVRGEIEADSPPMFRKFPGNPVFHLSLFQSEAFKGICQRVHDAEQREIESAAEGASAPNAGGGGHGFALAVQRAVDPLISRLDEVSVKLDAALCGGKSASSDIVLPQASRPPAHARGLPSPSPVQGGKRKKVRIDHLRYADGQVYLIPMGEHRTATAFWNEYAKGRTPLRDLEVSTKGAWRDYGSVSRRWSEQKFLYAFIETRIASGMSEVDAIQALQTELDNFPKRGRSSKPNWDALLKYIPTLGESAARKQRKPRPGRKGASVMQALPSVGDDDLAPVQFDRSGAVFVSEATGPQFTLPFDAFHVAPAIAAGSLHMGKAPLSFAEWRQMAGAQAGAL
jgi:Centromere DNA-binding protein complex CBF3 subunit, domain 2/Transcriptional activator of glycolytic enzymes